MSNLVTARLSEKNIGIVFGCFAPCHLGHFNTIMQAKRENDACIVVVCGQPGDRGEAVGLDLRRRFRYMRELFAEDEKVVVTELDETGMPLYPNGWTEWLEAVQSIVKATMVSSAEKLTWYVGEKEYITELEVRTNDFIRFINRQELPISATLIRENPYKYWRYIMLPFRRVFSMNILVLGTASGGKSTLVKDLGRYFDSPYTDEYARRYEEKYNVRDEELAINDFNYMGAGQFENNKNAIISPMNKGLMFADTDVLVTKVYTKYYCSPQEFAQLAPSFDLLIAQQQWEIIFVIPPITPYVNDDFRDMSYADETSRWHLHQLFMAELEAHQLLEKVVMLDQKGNLETDSQGFYARYEAAKKHVQNHVHNKSGIWID